MRKWEGVAERRVNEGLQERAPIQASLRDARNSAMSRSISAASTAPGSLAVKIPRQIPSSRRVQRRRALSYTQRTRSSGKKLTRSTWNASLAQRQALFRDGAENSGDQLCVREVLSGKRTPQASTPGSRARWWSHWLRNSFMGRASSRWFRGERAAAHIERAVGIDVRDDPVPWPFGLQS